MPDPLATTFTLAALPAAPLLYRPFLDPIAIESRWYLLLVPIAFFLSLAYKSVRVGDVKTLPRATLVMTLHVTLAMVALFAAFHVFVRYVLPLIAP